jgi:hypothetical protein
MRTKYKTTLTKKVMMMDWHPKNSKELSPPQEHVLASMQQPKLQKQVFREFLLISHNHQKQANGIIIQALFPKRKSHNKIHTYIHTYKKGPYPELVLYSTYNPLSYYNIL